MIVRMEGVVALTVKATKIEANYTGMAKNPKERCGLCVHYRPDGTCNRVVGYVSVNGWCRYFIRKVR